MDNSSKNVSGNFLRKPPASVEAEQAVLSAIISNNKALEKISEFLRPEHFVEGMHQKIYEACLRLVEKGHLADTITLKNYLESNGTLDMAGGIEYLMQLSSSSIPVVNAFDYGKLVYECALKRNLIEIGTEIVNDAFGGSSDEEKTASQQIESAEAELYNLANAGEVGKGPEKLESAMRSSMFNIQEAFKSDTSISGVSTELEKLDDVLGGLHPSDLLIVAGRPGMGKTTFSLNVAFNVANEVLNHRAPSKLNGPVLFFSLEMSADELSAKILAASAEVSSEKMRNGSITEDEFNRLVEHQRALNDLSLFIDDTAAITVPMIRTRARRLKRQYGGLALIVIDYVQLISGTGVRRSDNRVQEITEITRGLKMLAKELEVPVIALSQLSRSVESREDKRPQLADLRESGSIEQDADCVMFVFRKAYYLFTALNKSLTDINDAETSQKYMKMQAEYEQIKNTAEIIIAKHRHGRTDRVNLAYIGEFSKFGNLYEGTTEQ